MSRYGQLFWSKPFLPEGIELKLKGEKDGLFWLRPFLPERIEGREGGRKYVI